MIYDSEKNKYELKLIVTKAFKESSVLSVVNSAIMSAEEGSRSLFFIILFSCIWCGVKYPFSDGDHYLFLHFISALMLLWVFRFKILKEDYYAVTCGVGQREHDKNHDHRRRETFKKKLWDDGVGSEAAARVLNYIEEDREKSSIKDFDIGNLEVVLFSVAWGVVSLILSEGGRQDILVVVSFSGFFFIILLLIVNFKRYRRRIFLWELSSFLKDYMEDLSEGKTWGQRD